MQHKRILILGDHTSVLWHPLTPAEPHLRETLGSGFELTFSEAYPDLTAETLAGYDLVINYIDNWQNRGTVSAAVALQGWVAQGGPLLTLHSGIITRDPFFLLPMQGGAFTKHEAYTTLHFHAVGDPHPVTAGVEPFDMQDEPYEFELDPFTPRNHILAFELDGRTYPAGWVIRYGFGRIVYLAPGHDGRSFAVPGFQQLIRNSAAWLTEAE